MSDLMSFEDYIAGSPHDAYYFKIESALQSFFYFGEKHARDPGLRQWEMLERAWREFVQDASSPRKAFVEGGTRPVIKDRNEAIRQHGGAGLVTHLAAQENISVFSPEPTDEAEREMLLGEFSKDEIQYMYFARTALQWHRLENPPAFDEYLEGFLERDKEQSGWKDYDFSVSHMKQIHKSLFETAFDETDRDFFYERSNPLNTETTINYVSRTLTKFRDEFIIQKIKEEWNEGVSLFGNYGLTHVVMQEPALRKALK